MSECVPVEDTLHELEGSPVSLLDRVFVIVRVAGHQMRDQTVDGIRHAGVTRVASHGCCMVLRCWNGELIDPGPAVQRLFVCEVVSADGEISEPLHPDSSCSAVPGGGVLSRIVRRDATRDEVWITKKECQDHCVSAGSVGLGSAVLILTVAKNHCSLLARCLMVFSYA